MKFDVQSLSREDIMESLKLLKEYRTAMKQIGKRASLRQIAFPQVINRIEYAPSLDPIEAKSMAQSLFARLLPEVIYVEKDAILSVNNHLTGGLRLFIGDDMMDISFDRFAPLLMKANS